MAVSEKQLTFITNLVDQREQMYRNAGLTEQADAIAKLRPAVIAEMQKPTMSTGDGSKTITRMKDRNEKIKGELRAAIEAKRAEERANKPQRDTVTDGFYKMDDTIYKVVTSKAGRQYAKELITRKYSDEKGDSDREFVFAPGAISRLTPEHKMSLEDAEEYGQLYGRCLNCGRVLTAEDSIKRAMGPVCAGKFG